MLRWTLAFLLTAIVAAVLGFADTPQALAAIARPLALVCLVLFVLSLVRGLRNV